MILRGKKLGILLSTQPQHRNFEHGLRLAETALTHGMRVYLYCIDEAVRGIGDARVQALQRQGVSLFACAYAAQRRGIPTSEEATFAGLGTVSELIADTDRFVSFN